MATRFYFPASTAAAVSPAIDAGWTFGTVNQRRLLAATKGSSALANGDATTCSTNTAFFTIDRQYVSDPLAAQVLLNTATVKGQLMVTESNADDNVNRLCSGLRVVSRDGATVRGTIWAVQNGGNTAEFLDTGYRNKRFMTGQALSALGLAANYTIQEGDRLVLEIGYGVAAASATPVATAKWGENSTDLPEDNTQTTDGNGWFEISQTLSLYVAPSTRAIQLFAFPSNPIGRVGMGLQIPPAYIPT